MQFSSSLTGEASSLARNFSIGATVIAGQVVIWATTSGAGTLTDATTTAAADSMGVTLEAGTYSTTQGTGASSANVEVMTVYGPLHVYEANASGGAASNTAFSTTAPANILVNDTAETAGTTIIDTGVGTASMVGGWVFGLRGSNNSGQRPRIITAHTNNVSTAVTVPFDNDIELNARFLRVPWSPGVPTVQLTTELDQADATIATSTGIAAVVHNVILKSNSPTAPVASVYFELGDHLYNPA